LSNVPVIAIVVDDESFRQAAVSFIQSLGYATAAFASAEAFLHPDCGHDVDCLITDVQMPGMSGMQLQSHLIQHGRKLPIIFVTALSEMSSYLCNASGHFKDHATSAPGNFGRRWA
jgi:FixJ family two-component response regulator